MTTSGASPRAATATDTEEGTFLDALVAAVRRASEYNRHDQEKPAAVLWTDRERLWEPLLPALRARDDLLVLTLGHYDPGARSGPAYWLRCALAGSVPVESAGGDPAALGVPVIYLPGVSRADLRAVEDAPRLLQPLAELQYRGVLWTQKNGRDWTPTAFLLSRDGGLGIETAGDEATREALQRALRVLAGEPLARLRAEAPLRAGFFDELLHPDPVREVLAWLNDPGAYRARHDDAAWATFRSLVRHRFGVDPQTDGPITAATQLGKRSGQWDVAWQRFAEAPERWPGVPAQLRAAGPQQRALFDARLEETWPQDNEIAEAMLRDKLRALGNTTESEAREQLRQLEQEHAERREWVWARMRQSPLARALEYLLRLAAVTERPLGGPDVVAVAEAWVAWGWQADDAALLALAAADRAEDSEAVAAAIGALYRPWLEHCALAFQEAMRAHPERWRRSEPVTTRSGGCLLFSDALRYDAARRLANDLTARGLTATLDWRFTALPGVTPTAKPAITPASGQLAGAAGFDTVPASGGSRLTAEGLRTLLAGVGYQVLQAGDTGAPGTDARGWTELGAIDRYGHEHGRRLARHLEGELRDIADRVAALLDAGWREVTVVTDHGWLLLPGGLPKASVPHYLTEPRKGRCARVRAGEEVDQQTVPWHWDAAVRVAVPQGIGCYEAGKEYEHGGLSPQECVVPVLTVTRPGAVESVSIEAVVWRGLRCRVTLSAAPAGTLVDIRSKPADPATSLAHRPAAPDEQRTASLVVPDDEHEGAAAFVVVVGPDGGVVQQELTTVGG